MAYRFLDDKEQPQQENLGQTLGRTAARTVARSAEAVAGLPGDVASTVTGLAGGLTGADTSGIQKIVSPFTSKKIKENITERLTGNYLKPQGSGEEFWDEIVGDAATILLPGIGAAGKALTSGSKLAASKFIGKQALKAFGRSAAGNTARWAAEEVTGSPLIGAAAKIGTMALAGTVGGRKALTQTKNDEYAQAFQNLKGSQKFDINPEVKQLEKLYEQFSRGDNPNKNFLLDRFQSFKKIVSENFPSKPYTKEPSKILNEFGQPFLNKIPGTRGIKGGKVDLNELIRLKQDWNQYILDPKINEAAKNQLKRGVGIANKAIERYGQSHPEFYKPYQTAEELHSALQGTSYVQEFLNKHPSLQDSIKNPLVKSLFGYYAAHNVSIPAALGVGGAALGAREIAKTSRLLIKSPLARKYYKEAIESALKNDSIAMARNLAKLDKVADKIQQDDDQPIGRYKFID